jgi:hypothetical protein
MKKCDVERLVHGSILQHSARFAPAPTPDVSSTSHMLLVCALSSHQCATAVHRTQDGFTNAHLSVRFDAQGNIKTAQLKFWMQATV